MHTLEIVALDKELDVKRLAKKTNNFKDINIQKWPFFGTFEHQWEFVAKINHPTLWNKFAGRILLIATLPTSLKDKEIQQFLIQCAVFAIHYSQTNCHNYYWKS